MAIHACEQIVRRRPFMHFIPIGLALAGLILVNPYGELYLPYLLHGLTMARPLIVEWQPLWEHDARVFSLFLLSLLPISLVAREVGVRKLVGLAVLAATAYAAFRHTRHLSLYCVVWACYVPGYLQMTRFGTRLEQFTREYGSSVVRICAVISIVCLARAIPAEPWKLKIPTTNQAVEAGLVCYPTAAIEHLKTTHFHGNVIVPFEVGGYVMWNLYPSAKVSIDGRYEVAYQPGVLEDHLKLYAAKPGWRDVLDQFAADAVLIPCLSRLSPAMTTVAGWKRIYHDGVYEIYTREHRVAYELLSDGRIQDFNSPQSSTTTALAVLPD